MLTNFQNENLIAAEAYNKLEEEIDDDQGSGGAFDSANDAQKELLYQYYKKLLNTIKEKYDHLLFKDPNENPPADIKRFPNFQIDPEAVETLRNQALDLIKGIADIPKP